MDGLRGIAILIVLLYHAFFEVPTNSKILSHILVVGRLGWSGVDLFFVLSGFLIGGILLDARDSPRYYKTFYLRRAYRILPLYAVVLAFGFLQFIPHHWNGGMKNLSGSAIPFATYLTFTQNIWMGLLGTFGVGSLAVTWSLAVEEQFYLTIPFVIRKVRPSRLILFLGMVFILAPLLRVAILLSLKHGNFADYVLMPCRADALCLGVISALLVRTHSARKFLTTHRAALYATTGILFFGLIPLTLAGDNFATPLATIGYTWVALFYTFCLLHVLIGVTPPIQRILRNPLLMRLGVLAYCTYLVHYPLMGGFRRVLGVWLLDPTTAQFAGGLAGLVLAPLIAALSWRFFEKPILRCGHTYRY